MYSFSIRQFIREYIGDFYDSWMFGLNFNVMLLMFKGEGGRGLLIWCQHYRESLLHNQWDITISYYTPFMMDIINDQWAIIYIYIYITIYSYIIYLQYK